MNDFSVVRLMYLQRNISKDMPQSSVSLIHDKNFQEFSALKIKPGKYT